MPVLMPATSIKRSAASLPAVREHRAYYAQRLQSARANIKRLEIQLEPGSSRFNPDLAQMWQNEIVYWRQAERNAVAMLAQLGSANDARPG
jgi:uncharacterized protein YukE